jgi:hypothetical protein
MPKSAPAALVALCLSLAPAAMDAHAEPVLPAPPLQVEGTFWPLGSRVLSPDAPRRLISVDLGAAEDGGRPALEAGTAMTVFNVLGLWSALVVDVRKSCEFVCAFEEGETCHWQALLAPKLNAHYLGEPLLAIPAQHRVEAYEPLFARPAEAAVAWSPDFATPIWPPHGYDIRIEEWSPEEGLLRATLRLADGQEQAIEDQSCVATKTAGLIALACPTLALLAANGVPLLVSWTDYHAGVALPIARMRIDGREAVLVRYATKVDILHGLLVRDGERWVPLIRQPDYANVC